MPLPNSTRSLVGQTVLGEWLVQDAIDLEESGSTGGHFCIPYRVVSTSTGQRAFLKVLDVVKAIQRYGNEGIGVAETLSRISRAHIFEAQLMEACKERKLDRVVRALAYGEVSIDIPPLGPIGFPFLIFELADGDTHTVLQSNTGLDLAWWFSTLHQAAVGIRQLHGIEIAHQDVKPSNVVFFGVDSAKLADLGRAARKGVPGPNDERAGDARYVPPEYYYDYYPSEWGERYLAMDLYLLGSFAFSGIAKISMTSALFGKLPPEFHVTRFGGSYPDVLPALTKALADVLSEIRPHVPTALRELFIPTIAQLCHPDPSKRGHPEDHSMAHGSPYSLERYVSAFRRMAQIAVMELR